MATENFLDWIVRGFKINCFQLGVLHCTQKDFLNNFFFNPLVYLLILKFKVLVCSLNLFDFFLSLVTFEGLEIEKKQRDPSMSKKKDRQLSRGSRILVRGVISLFVRNTEDCRLRQIGVWSCEQTAPLPRSTAYREGCMEYQQTQEKNTKEKSIFWLGVQAFFWLEQKLCKLFCFEKKLKESVWCLDYSSLCWNKKWSVWHILFCFLFSPKDCISQNLTWKQFLPVTCDAWSPLSCKKGKQLKTYLCAIFYADTFFDTENFLQLEWTRTFWAKW